MAAAVTLRPTAAMVPHPRRRRIQQSVNMLCGKSMSLKLKNVYVLLLFSSYLKARRIVNRRSTGKLINFSSPWYFFDILNGSTWSMGAGEA